MNGWSFRAMGTTVRILTDGRATASAVSLAAGSIRQTFEREERRFSRFRVESELSRVNVSAGRPIRVSRTFASVMRLALDAAAATGGLFDPTVLGALEAAGYDRDFDEVLAGARGALHPASQRGRWRDVLLEDDLLCLPTGVGVDLGGLVKGWTADMAASRAIDTGLPWALVNAGGDLRIAGDAPPVSVSIEDPDQPWSELGRLVASQGGIATSSIRSRSWGARLHHVIDPRTGAPSETDLIQVTAAASTCAEAEVRAKEILLRGSITADESAVAVSSAGHVFVAVPMEEAA